MDKIPFEDGVKTQEAYVTVNGQNYPVTPAVWTGTTPLKAFNLNKMQDNIEEAINGVVESGSNANGSWVKFSDGTMMQWGRKTLQNVEFAQTGGIYYSQRQVFPFPQVFIQNPSISISGTTSNICWIGNSTSNTEQFTFNVLHSNETTRTVLIEWQAIGKWK